MIVIDGRIGRVDFIGGNQFAAQISARQAADRNIGPLIQRAGVGILSSASMPLAGLVRILWA